MKAKERQEARKLRREDGLSIRVISERLGVSKSSVSQWVRDVELTDEQNQKLYNMNPAYNDALRGRNGSKVRDKYKKIRQGYQDQGRAYVRYWCGNPELDYIAGCMLYWGEGSKGKNVVQMSNSDAVLLRLFVDFLREFFGVDDEKFSLHVSCYTTNGLTVGEIEKYWLEQLALPSSVLRKPNVNNHPKSSQQKSVKTKLIHGICSVKFHSTEIVQQIFGSIQEFVGFENEKWLG